jgi:hypothetical protein
MNSTSMCFGNSFRKVVRRRRTYVFGLVFSKEREVLDMRSLAGISKREVGGDIATLEIGLETEHDFMSGAEMVGE